MKSWRCSILFVFLVGLIGGAQIEAANNPIAIIFRNTDSDAAAQSLDTLGSFVAERSLSKKLKREGLQVLYYHDPVIDAEKIQDLLHGKTDPVVSMAFLGHGNREAFSYSKAQTVSPEDLSNLVSQGLQHSDLSQDMNTIFVACSVGSQPCFEIEENDPSNSWDWDPDLDNPFITQGNFQQRFTQSLHDRLRVRNPDIHLQTIAFRGFATWLTPGNSQLSEWLVRTGLSSLASPFQNRISLVLASFIAMLAGIPTVSLVGKLAFDQMENFGMPVDTVSALSLGIGLAIAPSALFSALTYARTGRVTRLQRHGNLELSSNHPSLRLALEKSLSGQPEKCKLLIRKLARK